MSCDCPPPGPPTLAGFLDFVRNVMGITTAQLPDASPFITLAYCTAKAIVNVAFAAASPLIYQQMVYNLGGSNLLNVAPDPTGAKPYDPDDPDNKLPFFGYMRKTYNMLGFVSGVIQAAADEATSESMVVPDAFKGLTLANLQMLKDPYGRAYLAYAQAYGPAAWGVS